MTEEQFARYDSADYLRTGEDIAAYLDAVLEEDSDDPAYIARALELVARALDTTALAQMVSMRRVKAEQALSGNGNPTLSTL